MTESRATTIGILPALGSGLGDLRRGGQHTRLLDYDLRHYAAVYERIYYFSYLRESLSEFTDDPRLLERVTVVPRRGPWPARLYALLMPFLRAREMRRCGILRVMQFPGVIPALIARLVHRVPFVVTYGYHYGDVARIAGSRLKPRLYRWLERLAFPRAATVIVTSPAMRDQLEAMSRAPRVAMFPNGIDTVAFAPTARPHRPRERRVVLAVGRLEPEKNLGRLVDAIALIDDPPVRLVLVGEGRERAELEQRAEARGVAIELRGVVPHRELPRHLAEADVYALPSLTEGHPKALIEAMASGVPCVGSARGGIPTLIEHGVSGLLFDPEDPRAIAAAIRRVLTDRALAERLAAAARREAVVHYDARVILTAEAEFVSRLGRAGDMTKLFEDYARDFPIDDDALPRFVIDKLTELGQGKPRAVLDLGAGDGRYLGLLKGVLPADSLLVGCEISVLRARRIAAKGHRVVVARAEELPFRPGAFDLVTCIEVIEHTESPRRALEEVHRALRPGGQLALTTPNYPMKRLFDVRAALRERSLARLRDDPTHISPLSARRLGFLLRGIFASVRLEGTAILGQGPIPRLAALRPHPLGMLFANKLFALCSRRPLPPRAL